MTGAASGIGLAIAHELAAGGVSVAVADVNAEAAGAAVAALVADGAKALAVAADVTSRPFCLKRSSPNSGRWTSWSTTRGSASTAM